MATRTRGRSFDKPGHEQVVLDCGCINHIGGAITFCKTHREAEALVAWMRALPFQGRETPTGGLIIGPDEWATARALLTKIEG